MEKKAFPFEYKELDDALGTFSGYAATFGNEDLVGDVIEPGAFTKTLSEHPKMPILWQHDRSQPIGVSLAASEDDYGLLVKGEFNLEVQQGREAYSLIKQGALSCLSIGYSSIIDKWDAGVRHLKELRLYEYSPVTFPANPSAQITGVKSCPELEDALSKLTTPELIEEAKAYILALVERKALTIPEEPTTPVTPAAVEPPITDAKAEALHLLLSDLKIINTKIGA